MTQKDNKTLNPYDRHVTVNISIRLRNLMAVDEHIKHQIKGDDSKRGGKRSDFIETAVEEKLAKLSSDSS